jgi:signal transduction histidine kinase/CHASE2 domain-containing sensor protein
MVTGGIIAALLIVLNAGGFFAATRLSVSNWLYVPSPVSRNIVIIAIDDASLAAYGRSPAEWSRGLHAQLVEKVNQAGARVLAFDLLFAEPSFEDPLFAEALHAARESDNRLRVVMPVAGVEGVQDSSPGILAFANALYPTRDLRAEVDYLGYVNVFPDADANIRRQPSQVQVQDMVGLSFPLVTYAAWLRINPQALPSVVQATPDSFTLAERTLQIDERGLWMQNFFSRAHTPELPSNLEVISFKDVIDGLAPPELFADRIVMVGVMRSTALSDEYYVPIQADGRKMTGVEIHANAIETLIQDRPLVAQSPLAQALMISVLALLAALIYAIFRWVWALPLMALLLVAGFITASVLMSGAGQVINLFYAGLAIAAPAAIRIGAELLTQIRRRQQSDYLAGSAVAVADQRLQLDRTLAQAGQSVSGLLESDHVAIWLLDGSGGLQARHWSAALRHGDLGAFDAVLAKARQTSKTVEHDGNIAIPMEQAGETIGIIAAATRKPLDPEKRQALTKLAGEVVAGGVGNALLYDRLTRQKALLETTFDHSPAGLIELDGNLRIVRGNLAADRALMSPSKDFVGLNIESLLIAAGVDEGARINLREAFAGGLAYRREVTHQGRTYEVDAAPLPGKAGWIVVWSDVSALLQLNEVRTRLLRIASHDLKNPLTRIQGFADLMNEGIGKSDFTPKDREYIRGILSGTVSMQRIIDDVLNTERLRTGKLEFQTLEVIPMVQEIIERHRDDWQDKAIDFRADLPESIPAVRGDRPQLLQAMSNLLSNAIKYTPEAGNITLRLKPIPDHIRYEVQDSGYGIPAKDQHRIFEEFVKVRTKATLSIPGTGLGLSLAKTVIESHGGKIGFVSEEGKGSTFYIELPFAPQEQAS